MNSHLHHSAQRLLLIVLDGFGINEHSPLNAIKDAKTPYIDHLFTQYPFCTLKSSGKAVGLPPGVVGNSEVGHLNIGAGRVFKQDLVRINEDLASGDFFHKKPLLEMLEQIKKQGQRLHLFTLLSDGAVHSHINHLLSIAQFFHLQGVEVLLHAFTDGRDTSPTSGVKFVENVLSSPYLKLASLMGRSIAMDRDERWEKTHLAYKTLIGEGKIKSCDPIEYVKSQYKQDITDEFITPLLLDEKMAITSEDVVFFLNYRPDRTRQLTLAFNQEEFSSFKNPVLVKHFLCMTPYVQNEITLPILYQKEVLTGGLGELLAKNHLSQVRLAETEKYPHVTYFFNGGRKDPLPYEKRFLIPSPREVHTYDEKPQMSAYAITHKLLEELDNRETTFFLTNFANSDMVGHTGNYQATLRAVEVLDECLKMIVEKCQQEKVSVIITSDHGNADQMITSDGTPHTAHTNADSPFCFIHPDGNTQTYLSDSKKPQALKDIAPFITHVLGIS